MDPKIAEMGGELDRQSRRQAIAFAAFCGEQAAPILRRFGSGQSRPLVAACLDVIWSAASGREVKKETSRLSRLLGQTPDLQYEDVAVPLSFASQAWGAILCGLEAVRFRDWRSCAKQSFVELLSALGSLNYRTLMADARTCCHEAVVLLRDQDPPTPQLLSDLRTKAEQAAARVGAALEETWGKSTWPSPDSKA